jgi:hypothetical protein
MNFDRVFDAVGVAAGQRDYERHPRSAHGLDDQPVALPLPFTGHA